MLKVAIGKLRHISNDQRVFAVAPAAGAGVVKAAGFDCASFSHDKFVMQDCVLPVKANRDVARGEQVNSGLAIAVQIYLFIEHHAHVNAARFCPDQGKGHIRWHKTVTGKPDFGPCMSDDVEYQRFCATFWGKNRR